MEKRIAAGILDRERVLSHISGDSIGLRTHHFNRGSGAQKSVDVGLVSPGCV